MNRGDIIDQAMQIAFMRESSGGTDTRVEEIGGTGGEQDLYHVKAETRAEFGVPEGSTSEEAASIVFNGLLDRLIDGEERVTTNKTFVFEPTDINNLKPFEIVSALDFMYNAGSGRVDFRKRLKRLADYRATEGADGYLADRLSEAAANAMYDERLALPNTDQELGMRKRRVAQHSLFRTGDYRWNDELTLEQAREMMRGSEQRGQIIQAQTEYVGELPISKPAIPETPYTGELPISKPEKPKEEIPMPQSKPGSFKRAMYDYSPFEPKGEKM